MTQRYINDQHYQSLLTSFISYQVSCYNRSRQLGNNEQTSETDKIKLRQKVTMKERVIYQ